MYRKKHPFFDISATLVDPNLDLLHFLLYIFWKPNSVALTEVESRARISLKEILNPFASDETVFFPQALFVKNNYARVRLARA